MNKTYRNDVNDLKKVKARVGELSKYRLLVETPDFCNLMSIVHFVYWDNEVKYLNDDRAEIKTGMIVDEPENPEKYWLKRRREELSQEYLKLGRTDHPLLSEVRFDFSKSNRCKYTLLMLYVGAPLMKAPKREGGRVVLFEKQGLYVQNLRNKFTVQERDEESEIGWSGLEKPALVSASLTAKNRVKRLAHLEDLFVKR